MSFTRTHEITGSLQECLREVTMALGHLNFEVAGNQIIARDHDKKYVIDLVYEGDRHLGSLNLPMTEVTCTCEGCTQAEADHFHDHLASHMLRVGGG